MIIEVSKHKSTRKRTVYGETEGQGSGGYRRIERHWGGDRRKAGLGRREGRGELWPRPGGRAEGYGENQAIGRRRDFRASRRFQGGRHQEAVCRNHTRLRQCGYPGE